MHFLKIHFLVWINAVGCVKNDTHLGAYTKCRQFSQCTCQVGEYLSAPSTLVIPANTCQLCRLLSALSTPVSSADTCYSGQPLSFLSTLAISVNTCHSCQHLSFQSTLVIPVSSVITCPSCQFCWFFSFVNIVEKEWSVI